MSLRVVEHEHAPDGHKGAFVIEVDGVAAARLTYSRAGDTTVILDHTEVSDVLRGQGAGKQLVEAAVAWARTDGLVLLPLCPFARSVFDKEPGLRDVLTPRSAE